MGYVFFRGQPSQSLLRNHGKPIFSQEGIVFPAVLIISFQSFSFPALINMILIPAPMRAVSAPNILPIEIFSAVFTGGNRIFLLSQCHDTSSFHYHFQAIKHPAGARYRIIPQHIRDTWMINSLSFFAGSFFPKAHSRGLPAFLWYGNAQTSPAKKG